MDHLYHDTAVPSVLQDAAMLERLKTLEEVRDDDRRHILRTLEALIRDAKTRQAYRDTPDKKDDT